MTAIGPLTPEVGLQIFIRFGARAVIFQATRFSGPPRQQFTNEVLQPLLVRRLKTQELHSHVIVSNIANDRFDSNGLDVA